MAGAEQRKVGRATVFMLLGAACVGFVSTPSAFFATTSPGSPSTTETVRDPEAAKAINEAFNAGPHFLKMAIPERDGLSTKLREIADKHGVRYRLPGKGQYSPWTMAKGGIKKKAYLLSGTKEAITNAFKEIRESTANSEGSASDRPFTFLFPKLWKSEMIGKGGENVKRFAEETSLHPNIESHPGAEASMTVTGDIAADKAVDWLLSIVPDDDAERRRAMLNIGSTSYVPSEAAQIQCVLYVPVPKDMHGTVIGKGGQRILGLSKDFHARLQLDKENSILKLEGLSGDVHALHTHLLLGILAE